MPNGVEVGFQNGQTFALQDPGSRATLDPLHASIRLSQELIKRLIPILDPSGEWSPVRRCTRNGPVAGWHHPLTTSQIEPSFGAAGTP
eukprot:4180150-Prymnesium_polylepis.2